MHTGLHAFYMTTKSCIAKGNCPILCCVSRCASNMTLMQQLQQPAEAMVQKMQHNLTLSPHSVSGVSPRHTPILPHCHPCPPPYTLPFRLSFNRPTTSCWVRAGPASGQKRLQHQRGQRPASLVQGVVRRARPIPSLSPPKVSLGFCFIVYVETEQGCFCMSIPDLPLQVPFCYSCTFVKVLKSYMLR